MRDRLKSEGWTDAEIARYESYTEESNPDLDENTALRLMAKLRKQVEARMAAGIPTGRPITQQYARLK